MISSRLYRLAATIHGEALLSSGEIRGLLQSAADALDEAARIAEEREAMERAGTRDLSGTPPNGDIGAFNAC